MLYETVRMVARWLNGTTVDADGNSQSVAVHLAAQPYDAGLTAPTAPTIYNELDQNSAARGDEPLGANQSLPALQVMIESFEFDMAAMVEIEQRGRARVLLRYLQDGAQTATGLRDAYLTMRAVRRSLQRLHLAKEANNGRLRNSIALVTTNEPMQFMAVAAPIGEETLACGLVVTYEVRELAV